jgi:hypothetical protein
METLLMAAVVLIALSVIVQAGVLVAMYLMSRKMADKADVLMTDARRLMGPLESVTSDLKSISNDLSETGKIARAQMQEMHGMITETRDNIRGQMFEIRERLLDTVDEARDLVMRPLRHYSAVAAGISTGVRTFFSRKRREPGTTEIKVEERKHPAA